MSLLLSENLKMGDNSKLLNESSDNLCVLCFKYVEFYSIGECDHPVCYECSTRMRVLCEQNECPICRQNLSKVIFTNEVKPYRVIEKNNRSEYYNKKYKICFSNLQIQKAFYDLLDHRCPKCDSKSFHYFDALKDHVRKEHELFYCDLCTDNLKIFSFERKCYNRQELGLHRRKGDPDNTSHRGHPLCEYCDIRYLDKDELFRHLRRQHYFCHICDVDGPNQFYADYNSLCEHFRSDHYICEEGQCATTEQLTNVFPTEIDLKAHIANVHGKSLGKQQAKQARTLQFEITLGPRSSRGGGGGGNHSGGGGNHQDFPSVANIRSNRGFIFDETGNNSSRVDTSHSTQATNYNPPKIIDASNDQEFPSLGGTAGTSSGSGVTLVHPNMSIRARAFGPANIIRSKDEFPALGSTSGGVSSNYDTGPSTNQNSKYNNNIPVSAIFKNHNVRQQAKSTNSGGNSMVIHVSNRPNITNNSAYFPSSNVNTATTTTTTATTITKNKFPSQKDFPALPGSSSIINNIPTTSNVNLNSAVSAKHRQLINDYVPVAHPTTNSKITVVQNDNAATSLSSALPSSSSKKHISNESLSKTPFVPSLTTRNFPALGEGNNSSRKSKILSSSSSSSAAVSTTANSTSKYSDNNKEQKLHQQNLESNHNQANNNNNNKKSNNKSNGKKSTIETNKKSENGGKSSNKENRKSENENKTGNNKNMIKRNKSSSSLTLENAITKNCVSSDDDLQQKQKKKNNNMNSMPPPGFDKIIIDDSSNNTNTTTSNNVDCIDSGNNVNNISNNNNHPPVKLPPPGFKSVTLNSIAKPLNDLTFTTSLGEMYSIVPNHQFIPPPNSVKRNQDLVKQFQQQLQYHEGFEEFKHISQKFREGQYKTIPYYEHCQAALKDKFDEYFPELLVLLPDINKQQELYLVHCQYTKQNKKNQKNKSSIKLEVCPTCKQVLKLSDKQAHMKAHTLENNFPALNGKSITTSSTSSTSSSSHNLSTTKTKK